MKCIFGNVDNYYLKFSSSVYKSCPYSAKYGPLSTKVPFVGDIWIGTLIFAFVGIVSMIIIYYYLYSLEKIQHTFCFIFDVNNSDELSARKNEY